MRGAGPLITSLFILAAVGGGGYLLWTRGANAPALEGAPAGTYQNIPGGIMQYSNESIDFSFNIPDGYIAEEGFYNGGPQQYVRLRKGDGNGPITLMTIMTPVKTDGAPYTLYQARRDAPNTVMDNAFAVRPMQGITGVAFQSSNPLWKTASSTEVWFEHDGYRYQVATPSDQSLLDFVFGSWHWSADYVPSPEEAGPLGSDGRPVPELPR